MQSTVFRPSSIHGMTLWLRPNSYVVPNWPDALGLVTTFTQSTGAKQPTATNSVATFDGTNDGLESTTLMSSVLTTTAKTVFVVFKATTASPTDASTTLFYTNTKIFSHFDNYFGINYRGVSNKIQFGNYSGSGAANEHAYTVNTKALIGGTHDGTNLVSNLNGGATSSVASGASGLIGGAIVVGYNTSGGGALPFTGLIYEICCWNRVLDAVEYGRVQHYLLQTL